MRGYYTVKKLRLHTLADIENARSAVCLASSCIFLFLLKALSLVAIVLATAMIFESFPGARLHGPPVPDDLSGLIHSCTGPNCTFCTWRRENPIELWWERLLEPEEACSTGSTLCGVDLTGSQMLDPSCELSTQQVTGFLANFDDENYFPHFDAEFEQVLTQVETSTSQLCYR